MTMALSTSYYTVDDEIVGESRGGTKVDYLTDALGSVTAKVNQAGAVISSARYKPYGDMMSGPSYIFGWIGSYGDRKSANGSYVRERHLTCLTGGWSTMDSYWPSQTAYGYAHGSPTSYIDPSGKATIRRNLYKVVKWPPVCGAHEIWWTFTISPKNASSTGWLVQDVTALATGTSCDPNGPPVVACTPPKYFEAWLVVDGVVYTPSKDVPGQWKHPSTLDRPDKVTLDQWGNRGYACSHGHLYTRGSLKFIPDPTASPKGKNSWLEKHGFTKANYNQCSLALPSTSNYIGQTTGAWVEVARLTSDFNCCKKPGSCLENCRRCNFEGPCAKDVCTFMPDKKLMEMCQNNH